MKSEDCITNQRPGLRPAQVISLVIAACICVNVILLRDQLRQYEPYGYVGAFVANLLGSIGVLVGIPVPGMAVAFALGSVYNPLLIGLCAGTGAALGEINGYLAGSGGKVAVEQLQAYSQFDSWMSRYGAWTIFIASAVPNPMFDVAGIAAGASGMAFSRFLVAVLLGKTIRMTLTSFAGRWFGAALQP
jgi:membrane protein DedA with SNARE-associated domain